MSPFSLGRTLLHLVEPADAQRPCAMASVAADSEGFGGFRVLGLTSPNGRLF